MREGIRQKGESNLFRILIKGFRNPDMEFDDEPLYHLGNITQVRDETRPCYDVEKLKEQQKGTLIGDYIRCFEEKNSPMEQKALYYGVQALMETKQ